MPASRLITGIPLLLVCLLCGCASTGLLKFGKEEFPKAGPKNPVVHVMAMWQPATGVGLEGRTCRGFAGQVFFISANSPTPALIDGDIMIWLFDDQGTPQEQAKPIHKFQFDADSWKTHARKADIGLTYSVFIPYTRKGTHSASCALMVAYTPRGGGPTLNSEMISIDLAGSKPKTDPAGESAAAATSEGAVDSIEDAVAEKGRDLGRRFAEATQIHDAASPTGSRQETRQAAAGAAALAELERAQAPRKLSRADEQRLIREARARLAAAGQPDDASRVADYPVRPRIQLRRNPLEEDTGNDRNDSADKHPTDLDWLKPGPGERRNPLLDSDLDVDSSEY